MFIAVKQLISENTLKERAPRGYAYDDAWEAARQLAGCLRQQYQAWLEKTYPDAMIEVDKVMEGNGPCTTEVQVVVYSFGRNNLELVEVIEPALNLIYADFDMTEIETHHLQPVAATG
ncbi:MAG: hypothetical protein P4L36_15765 [Holophaga sp.]|nr:hypothetical protein [Holophaga sp.]